MPVIQYKCPNCGGNMTFDSETETLACISCGREDRIEDLPDPLTKATFAEHEAQEYQCESCGAVLITDAETASTTCSFCGSNMILGDRLAGKLAPVKVIPFAVSKDEAIQAFRKWCRKGLLTPKGFQTADRIQSIKGIYVPFWLYDLHNHIEVEASGTKVRTYVRGDYRYTETEHFDIYREIELKYVKVPVDASEKMSDELMDKLEPFPYDKLKRFNTAYLAGYAAEKYSLDGEQLLPRAKDKISGFIDEYIQSTISGYTTVHYRSKKIETTPERVEYVLLPVWMLQYDYKKRKYIFAMNGQTGKVVGKPPISKGKVAAWFAGIASVSFFSLKTASWMMGGGFW